MLTQDTAWQGIWLLRGGGHSGDVLDLGMPSQQLCTYLVESQIMPLGASCNIETFYPLNPAHFGQ